MKILCLAAAAATISLTTATGVQAQTPQPPRIVTSGEGQTRVTPDRATVFVGVQTRGATAAVAAADNARRQKAILDTLKSLGLGSDQIATQNYSVSPEMRYDPPGSTPRLTGYVVSNTVRVELKRIDQVGLVIDAALAKGANDIGGIQFTVGDVAEPRRLAIAEAVKNARADAEALAKAAGGSLGPLLELSSSGPVYRPMFNQLSMKAESMARVPTPIEPGEQILSASVAATWQFVPGPPR